MGFFGQGRSTVEWQESRPDVLFYKWKENELKKAPKHDYPPRPESNLLC